VTDFEFVRITRSFGILACLVAACSTGCGGGGDDPTTTTRGPETSDPPADLPRRWNTEVNRAAGFSIGVPPGWFERRGGGLATLIYSPDRRVAVSISADRTDESLDQPLDVLVRAIATSLRGQSFEWVRAGKTKPLPHRYEAVTLSATARSRRGVSERLQVIGVRRDGLADYTLLVARRATVPRRLYRLDVERMIRSLRGRPVSATG
jgi:hypothetical protein